MSTFTPLATSTRLPILYLSFQSSRNYRRLTQINYGTGWNPPLGTQRKCQRTGCTDGKYLECVFQRASPSKFLGKKITPLPKTAPVTDVNKHLKPISLTPILSKVGKDFVVDDYVKPTVIAKIDKTIMERSSTLALHMHLLACSTIGIETLIELIQQFIQHLIYSTLA